MRCCPPWLDSPGHASARVGTCAAALTANCDSVAARGCVCVCVTNLDCVRPNTGQLKKLMKETKAQNIHLELLPCVFDRAKANTSKVQG